MSNKLKGTLLGFCASLAGVALWIILSSVGFIAGLSGVLMGILFVLVYTKFNDDISKYKYVMAGIVTFIDIILAEFLCLVIFRSMNGYTIAETINNENYLFTLLTNVFMGVALSTFPLVYYFRSKSKKNANIAPERIRTDTVESHITDEETKENEE